MRTKRTYAKGERLLAKLRQGYSIMSACRAEGIGRSTYYEWREADEAFRKEADDAIEDGTDRIEDVMRKRAIDGDNTMIALMLKARRPKVYRDNATVEHTGKDGESLTIVLAQRPDGPQ